MLSLAEAEAIRENLEIGLKAVLEGLDWGLTHSNKARAEAVIWQTIDDEDVAYLVGLMLNAGVRIPAASAAVRALAQISHQYKVGTILLPRFLESWRFYSRNGLGFWL